MKLADLLKDFFRSYLHDQRSLSPNTLRSYRDTFKFLIQYLHAQHGPQYVPRLEDLTPKTILAFLKYLEDPAKGRGNCPRTRNHRLVAIQSFFHYISLHYPFLAHLVERINSIPTKRVPTKVMGFLDRQELQALLKQPKTHTSDGIRDLALMTFAYNVGARASEMTNLQLSSFNFPSRTVTIIGKGNKERVTPLWPSIVRLLKLYADHHRRKPRPEFSNYFFINQRGRAFNRFGIRALVKRHLKAASRQCPSLAAKTLSTHSLRHTCAVHLLESRVDPNVIKAWLGHASVQSTDAYLDTDLTHKRRILDQFGPPPYVNGQEGPEPPDTGIDLLDWLDDL